MLTFFVDALMLTSDVNLFLSKKKTETVEALSSFCVSKSHLSFRGLEPSEAIYWTN